MQRKITRYEVHAVVETPLGYRTTRDDDEASFFTLYGVLDNSEVVAIGDYETRELGEKAKELIESSR